jgi:heme exporter protein C
MKKLAYVWVPATVALLIYGFMQAWFIAPTEATMGNIQRIFYYHFAAGNLMFLFFFLSFAASIGYLIVRGKDPLRAQSFDAFALANAEMGTIFCATVLIQGPLWARPVWGIWWTWDARLTSTLVLFLIYVAYLMVRRFAVAGQTQTLAAVIAVFGFLDVPIVYMSIRWWRTQHPSPVMGGGSDSGLAWPMWVAVFWNLGAWLAWGLMLMAFRYYGIRREQRREQQEALAAMEASLDMRGQEYKR